MFCKYCGRPLDELAKFCRYCGKETDDEKIKALEEELLKDKDEVKSVQQLLREKEKELEKVNSKKSDRLVFLLGLLFTLIGAAIVIYGRRIDPNLIWFGIVFIVGGVFLSLWIMYT